MGNSSAKKKQKEDKYKSDIEASKEDIRPGKNKKNKNKKDKIDIEASKEDIRPEKNKKKKKDKDKNEDNKGKSKGDKKKTKVDKNKNKTDKKEGDTKPKKGTEEDKEKREKTRNLKAKSVAEPNDYSRERTVSTRGGYTLPRDVHRTDMTSDDASLNQGVNELSVYEEIKEEDYTKLKSATEAPKPAPRPKMINQQSNSSDNDVNIEKDEKDSTPSKPVPQKRRGKDFPPPPLPPGRKSNPVKPLPKLPQGSVNEDEKTSDNAEMYLQVHDDTGNIKEDQEEETSDDTEEDSTGFKVVVAIDFGTTFSGYAYSRTSTKDHILMNENWVGPGGLFYKTPTSVVMDEHGQFKNFGFEAQELYFKEEENKEKLHYYEEFKLMLMKENLSEHTLIETKYGKSINAVQLFAEVLKYFKKHIMAAFHKQGYNYKVSNIRWVLTVPAIWENNQKLFMRRAAAEAKLIDHVESNNLLIALEPEAASLYCRSLKMNRFKGCAGNKELSLPIESIYIVIDAGGGTIDITVHKIIEGGKTAEIDHAKGGAWGGSNLNGRFQLKIKSILGEDFMDYCQKENPLAWLELVRKFELVKQSVHPNSDKKITISVGMGLAECYMQFKNESISKAFEKADYSGIRLVNGKIELDADSIREIFKPVVFKTTDLLTNLLRKPKIAPVGTIFIVGGFGQCVYLQEEIKACVDDTKRRVLIPAEGNLCVLRGAVMFGHQLDYIAERVARYTYAYLTTREYDEMTDEGRSSIELPNGDQVIEYLEPIIQKDDHIGANQEIIKDFLVENEEFTLDIYTSENREVDDPTSPLVSKKGTLKISLPRNKRHSKLGVAETVRVVFTLGTELMVKGIHMESKTSTQAIFSLLA